MVRPPGESRRWLWRIVALSLVGVWLWLIFYFSTRTGEEASQAVRAFSWLGALLDEVGHLALYGMLGALLQLTLWTWRYGEASPGRWVLAVAAVALLYGLLDEYLQSLVPGRTPSLKDLALDGAGAASAALLLRYLTVNWRNLLPGRG